MEGSIDAELIELGAGNTHHSKLSDTYDDNDEIEIDIHETMSGKYLNTTGVPMMLFLMEEIPEMLNRIRATSDLTEKVQDIMRMNAELGKRGKPSVVAQLKSFETPEMTRDVSKVRSKDMGLEL